MWRGSMLRSNQSPRRTKAPRLFGPLVAVAAIVLSVATTTQPILAAALTPSIQGVAAQGSLGSAANPLKMAFVPSADSQKVLGQRPAARRPALAADRAVVHGSVPTSYAAVIEAMGAKNVDVGWLAPFAYVLAHDKFKSQVILASVRGGSKTYTGQIITHADSGIDVHLRSCRARSSRSSIRPRPRATSSRARCWRTNGIDPKDGLLRDRSSRAATTRS